VASVNVDLVRSIRVGWERGDFGSAEWAHPEIEVVWADGPTAGRLIGVAAAAQSMREFVSTWAEFRVEAEEFRELDDERVLVLIRQSGRGKTSGLELGGMRAKGAELFRIVDGKVTKLVIYLERDNALADLGLGPEGDTPSRREPKTARDIYGDSWIDYS
jgi:hypothetical protein